MHPRDNDNSKNNAANPSHMGILDRALTLFQGKPRTSASAATSAAAETAAIISSLEIESAAYDSHTTHTLFQPNHEEQSHSLLQRALHHAVYGEWDDVDQLLMASPELLTVRGTVERKIGPDRAYKFTDLTIWQIALKNEEAEHENVFAMFKRHFKRLKNVDGLKEMAKQFHEIFPDGEMKKYDWDIGCSKILFRGVCDAIANCENPFEDDSVKIQVKMFFDYAASCASSKKGLIFDIQLLVDIMEFRISPRIKSVFTCPAQYEFYEQMIFDYVVLSLLPTGSLRPICQGIIDFILPKPLTVNGCRLSSGETILPRLDPTFNVDQDRIDIIGNKWSGIKGCRGSDPEFGLVLMGIEKLVQHKNESRKKLEDLFAAVTQPVRRSRL